MYRTLANGYSKVAVAALVALGFQLGAWAQVVDSLSALWANQDQQVMVQMNCADESPVLLYQTVWAADEAGPYSRLGSLFAPRPENGGQYFTLYDSPVAPGTPLFIKVRAFLNDSTTEDSVAAPAHAPALQSLSGCRPWGGQQIVVTVVSGSEAHTVAYLLLWAADPAGPFQILDGPFPPNFVDVSVYTRIVNSPGQSGPLYIRAQAILDESTVEDSVTVSVRDVPGVPPNKKTGRKVQGSF